MKYAFNAIPKLLLVALVCAWCAGCSTAGVTSGPSVSTSVLSGKKTTTAGSIKYVYVTDYALHELLVYNASDVNPAPVRTQPLTGGIGVATDQEGDVYVAANGNSVEIFSSGAAAQIGSITGLGSPFGLTVDGQDNLYVANSDPVSHRQRVSVFAHGSTVPFRVIYAEDNDQVHGVAVDGSGNLFMDAAEGPASSHCPAANIQESLPGQSQASIIVCGLAGPGGLTADGSGNLYASEVTSVRQYVVPSWKGTTVENYGSGYDTGFLSFGRDSRLYVPVHSLNGNDQKVYVYGAGLVQLYTISQGLKYPLGVATGI